MNRGVDSGDDAGFFRHSIAVVSALVDYFKARFQLAGLESKEAGVHYGIIAALAVAAVFVVLLGYFFLCFALVFLIAWLLGDGHAWIWVTFGMALLHFGAAVACLWIAKGRFAEPVFAATLEEFKKDQEWLKVQGAKPH